MSGTGAGGGGRAVFLRGMKDGLPIGLGYFAVSFSLGITAGGIGLNALQSFVASLLCLASAGEYAGFTVIAADAAYIEIAVITLVANARYLLMSAALSQRLKPETPMRHRFGLAYTVTDELFGIAIAQSGALDPVYSYGAVAVAAPMWAVGTAVGTVAGSLLPARLVSALGVALYGMFLAVFIPESRKNKLIAGIVAVCFALSAAAAYLPYVRELSGGMRTIILTVVISAAAALLFPRAEENAEGEVSEVGS